MSDLKHITRCRLCGQAFTDNPLDVPIVGQPPSARVQRFVRALYQHIEKRHQPNAAGILALTLLAQGYLVVNLFESEDPALQDSKESARAQLFSLILKNRATDANLRSTLAALSLTEAEIAKVEPAFRQLRDYLSESGQFRSPLLPAPLNSPGLVSPEDRADAFRKLLNRPPLESPGVVTPT